MALIPLQTDIERALTDFIRSEINNNSYDIKFSLGYWTNTTDREGQNVEIIEVEGSKYETEEVRIVPMSIESYVGNITNIEGLFNADYTIPLTFQIYVDDEEHFNDAINAINEFKNNLRGQIKRLEVSHNNLTEIFTAVTSTDNLTPQGNLSIMMGQTYAFAGLSLSFDISKNINYGNQVWIYLAEYDEATGETLPNNESSDYNRIFALAPSFNRTNTPEAFQNFNTKDVVHIIKDTEYTFSMQMFIQDDDLHWSLLEDVIKKEALNKPYSLKLDFKYYDINNDLVTKFSFVEPVVILDATPSFSIGEPQYLEVAFGKYLTESEVTDPGDIPETPDLPKLTTPSLQQGTGSFEIINPPNSPLGYSITRFFVNESETETVDIKVCVGSQCVTVENIEPGNPGEFTFVGLKQETAYTFNAIALGDGENFNNSEPFIINFFTPTSIATPFNIVDTIGEATNNGFSFTLENPNNYPIEAFVDFNNNFSQGYLLNENTTATFNYTNNNLVQGTNNIFTFVYNSLSEYGEVVSEETTNRTVFIPAVPQAANPEIKNFSISRGDEEIVVNWEVQNKHNENVDIFTQTLPGAFNEGVDLFRELNVPKFGEAGDTNSFSVTYISVFNRDYQIIAQAESRIEGELDSEEVTFDFTLPNFLTSDLDVEWIPTKQTDRVIFDVTNNNSYFTRFDIALYLNDVEVPNSLRSTNSALYDGLDPGETFRFEFIDGENDTGRPPLVINGNSSSDVYKLGVRSKSDNRDETDIKFHEGYLARKVSDYVFSYTQDSDLTTSYIRATFTNNEPDSVLLSYGIGTMSTYQSGNIIDSTTIASGQSTDEIVFTVSGNNLDDDQYIYFKFEPISNYLLDSDELVSVAITPEPLQTGYEVEFVDFDNTLIEEEGFDNPQFVAEGEDATAPNNPSRNYYTFDSWDTVFTNVQQDLTVKAQYDANDYTITYNLGTSGTTNTNPNSYNIEGLPVTLVDPTKEGYEFNGWFKEQAYTNQVTEINQTNFPTLGNITLYGDLQEITLDPVEFSFSSTATTSTITVTNPATNPSSTTENDIRTQFGVRKKSDGTIISNLTLYSFGVGNNEFTVDLTGLEYTTDYEVFGNGTNEKIKTFDADGIYVENEQDIVEFTTANATNEFRVTLNLGFGNNVNTNYTYEVNGVSNSVSVTTGQIEILENTLGGRDEVFIDRSPSISGYQLDSISANGENITPSITTPDSEFTFTMDEDLDVIYTYSPTN